MSAEAADGKQVKLEAAKKKWDTFSDLYAHWMQQWSLPLAATLTTQLQTRVPAAEKRGLPKLVVDVGCGPGVGSAHAARCLPADWTMKAFDLSPEMAKRAAEELQKVEGGAGAADSAEPRLSAGVAPADSLPLPDASAGAIMSNLCLMITPDPDAALAELRRVLAPGGVLAFSVWGRPAQSPMFTLTGKAMEEAGLVSPSPSSPSPGPTNFTLGQDKDALRERVKAAGFDSVLAWHVQAALPATTPEEAAAFRWAMSLHPASGKPLEEECDAATKDQVVTAWTAAYAEVMEEGKPIALDTTVIVAK